MMERREKDLCYNCDEKFHRNHVCKGKMFALLLTEDTFPANTSSKSPHMLPEPNPPPDQADHPEISLHALDSQPQPHTFCIDDTLCNCTVHVLIDSSSTHNFIQHHLVQFLQLPIQPVKPFDVLVGNGERLNCNTKCSAINLSLQCHCFIVDCFLLPIQGADIVLSIQWLQQLGNIITNFSNLTMSFQLHDKHITLQGICPSPLSNIPYNQLLRLSAQHSIASIFHLSATFISDNTTPTDTPSQLQPLLTEFQDLFSEPDKLPPPRPINHQIILQPNTAPINVRPYRYPHYMKSTIEQMVQQMLATGIIQPSTSPFSSPVLLVKKHA